MLLLGEEGVGKTTLLTSFLTKQATIIISSLKRSSTDDDDSTTSTRALKDQRLASALPFGRTLHLIEASPSSSSSSSLHFDNLEVISKIRFADVFLLCYNSQRSASSLAALETVWIPLLKYSCDVASKSVILIGLQADNDDDNILENDVISEEEPSLVQFFLLSHSFIVEHIRCSAARRYNIDAVFRRAEIAFLYPLLPLYSPASRELSIPATRAFTRIFRIFDRDLDNLLSLSEFQCLHDACFGGNLTPKEAIAFIERHYSAPENSLSSPTLFFLSLDDFLHLIEDAAVSRLTPQLWLALQNFHYDESLHLETPDDLSLSSCGPEQGLVLSKDAVQFLSLLFANALKDSDEPSSRVHIAERIFAEVVDVSTVTTSFFTLTEHILFDKDSSSLVAFAAEDWLAVWAQALVADPTLCLHYLFLLGYDRREDVGIVAQDRLWRSSCRWTASLPPNILPKLHFGRDNFISVLVISPSVENTMCLLSEAGVCAASGMNRRGSYLKVGEGRTMFINYWFEVTDDCQQLSGASVDYDVVIILFDSEREVEGAQALEASLPPIVPRVFVEVEPNSETGTANNGVEVTRRSHLSRNSIPVYPFEMQILKLNELTSKVVRNPELFMHSRPKRKEWFWGMTTIVAAGGTIALCIFAVRSFRLKHIRGPFLPR